MMRGIKSLEETLGQFQLSEEGQNTFVVEGEIHEEDNIKEQ